MIAPGSLSEDQRWYWTGEAWASALSPHGRWYWDGRAWQPIGPPTKRHGLRLWVVTSILATVAVGSAAMSVWAPFRYRSPGPHLVPLYHARPCPSASIDTCSCIDLKRGIVTDSGQATPSECIAVVQLAEGGTETLYLSCDNMDVFGRGAHVPLKYWRGELVEFDSGGVPTYRNQGIVVPGFLLALGVGSPVVFVLTAIGSVLLVRALLRGLRWSSEATPAARHS